jgi:hypothetical protein
MGKVKTIKHIYLYIKPCNNKNDSIVQMYLAHTVPMFCQKFFFNYILNFVILESD